MKPRAVLFSCTSDQTQILTIKLMEWAQSLGCTVQLHHWSKPGQEEGDVLQVVEAQAVLRCLCCGHPQHAGECPGEATLPLTPVVGQVWREGRSYEEEHAYLQHIRQQWGLTR